MLRAYTFLLIFSFHEPKNDRRIEVKIKLRSYPQPPNPNNLTGVLVLVLGLRNVEEISKIGAGPQLSNLAL